MAHFVALFISVQNIVTFKLPFGATGVIGDSNDCYLLVTISKIFLK
jgi:hypothetical protein